MDEAIIKKRLTLLALLLVVALSAWWAEFKPAVSRLAVCEPDLLCVVFLDVGQGDAIFIESPTNTQLLIDSGRDASVLRELAAVMDFSDRDLDYILITHPDADHVTGFKEVSDRE